MSDVKRSESDRLWVKFKMTILIVGALVLAISLGAAGGMLSNVVTRAAHADAQEFTRDGKVLVAKAVERHETTIYDSINDRYSYFYKITHEYYVPGTDNRARISDEVSITAYRDFSVGDEINICYNMVTHEARYLADLMGASCGFGE